MADPVSADEVARHAAPDDCWVVVHGTVWDLTEFAPMHPGGADVIYTHAGRDATSTYNDFHEPGLLAATLPVACKIGLVDASTVSPSPPQQQQAPPERVKPSLSDVINLHDFEAAFAIESSAKTQAYIGGAANDELTLRANLDHWTRLGFRPRVLRDVSRVATRSTMLGCDVRSPVFIAPMGLGRTGGPEAEAALGRGAQAAGLVHCVSTMASLSLTETLKAAPGHPFWFQLYVDRDRSKTEALLRQVRNLPQVRAILFTVDLPVVSKREADERVRNAATNAAGFFASGITGRRGADDTKGGGLARSTGSFIDSTLTWADVPWVRRHAGGLPVLAKGIQSAADARLALRAGCDGIVVSNHGGRALDGAPSSVLVLLELRRDCPEVFTRMEVYVDGGVRRGSDVLKAVCLGARGVGVGRPFQYAISYGTEGVEKCANIIQDELETAMRLCGVTDLNKVRGDMTFLNVTELEGLLPPRKEKYPPLGSAWSRLWAKL